MAIPSALPISLSQITSEFGGNSLLTAAPAAGLSAPVSISSFAGMSFNEGSGSFDSGYYEPWCQPSGGGFSLAFVVFGTSNNLLFCNGGMVAGFWQGTPNSRLTIYGYLTEPNSNATFHSVTINGVKRYRADANYSLISVHQWVWYDVPVGTIVPGPNYVPIWRTS